MRRAAIERLLPAAYQRAATPGSVLGALIDAMEALQEPDERILANIDDLFSAYRAPDGFVAYLTQWVALDYMVNTGVNSSETRLPLPIGRVRDLVAEGARLAQWRGTPTGMRRALALATGLSGYVVDEPADRPFHLVVRVPPGGADRLALITRVVEAEKPAATTFEVTVDPSLPDNPPAPPPSTPDSEEHA
ncbi:phage tail protein [Hamadaea tsunoensis]|uniref:phage tail protein n=1 Tax=Hamadaea tsunoensis TaxID=53368 RepID=UPI000425A446|nr:phage tail protein [Hamadaea tsunoensis]